jgi:formamidopyrimidine-DNA glycosylase
MTAQPEPMGAEPFGGAERLCPDCGGQIEAESATDRPFFICRSCYDAYVDNAGR